MESPPLFALRELRSTVEAKDRVIYQPCLVEAHSYGEQGVALDPLDRLKRFEVDDSRVVELSGWRSPFNDLFHQRFNGLHVPFPFENCVLRAPQRCEESRSLRALCLREIDVAGGERESIGLA